MFRNCFKICALKSYIFHRLTFRIFHNFVFNRILSVKRCYKMFQCPLYKLQGVLTLYFMKLIFEKDAYWKDLSSIKLRLVVQQRNFFGPFGVFS